MILRIYDTAYFIYKKWSLKMQFLHKLITFYLLCLIFAPLNSFAQSLCEQDFSAFENGKLTETSTVRSHLVQNAERKLEQDLEIIRSSPKEPLLKKQGFTPGFYLGIDQVREFNRVQEYLQEIKADSTLTHIPYFADQVEQIITTFERDFKEQNKNDINFLKDRLKLLEKFKIEAQNRIKSQKVTYNWWANFTFRLALLGTKRDNTSNMIVHYEEDSVRKIGRDNTSNMVVHYKGDSVRKVDTSNRIVHYFTNPEILEEKLQLESLTVFSEDISLFKKIRDRFPEEVMFFPTEANIGIMASNAANDHVHIIALTGKQLPADTLLYEPFAYYFHDLNHVRSVQNFNTYYASTKSKEIERRLDSISNRLDREKAEIALFLFKHEHIKERGRYLPYLLGSDSLVSRLADRFKVDHDTALNYLWEPPNDLSQDVVDNILALEYQQESNSAFIKALKEKEFKEALPRSFSSVEAIELLDHLDNTYVKRDKESAKKFLSELADVFIEHFSDLL